MTTQVKTSALVFLLATASLSAACGGGGNAEMSLSGPSVVTPTSVSGASISGRVNSGSGLAQTTSSTTLSSTAGLTVTVAGTTISSPLDSLGRFTLNGVPAGPVQLEFRGPGVNATVSITVNPGEQIQIAVTVNGNSAHLESQQRSGSNNRAEAEGSITAIDASARTIRVSGTLVTVPADASIRRGGQPLQFSDLAVGDVVEVRGTMEGATFRASEVRLRNERGNQLTERHGVISGLSGTCPSLAFTVAGTRVTTSGSTYFDDVTCATLQSGAAVEVKGQLQADGSLAAVKVERDDEDADDNDDDGDDGADEAEIKGTVASLSGTCPTLAFTVRSTRVTTTAATRFEDGACSAVQNNRLVEVEGARQADGSIAARKVKIER